MKKCPKCNWENNDDVAKCTLCGADLQGEAAEQPAQAAPVGMPGQTFAPQYDGGYAGNTSGMGSTAAVPAEIRGWSWAAFLMSWIWSIAHNTWLGLLVFVPYVGFIMNIILGVKGNEWAWQNRKWESVEQFKATQRVWVAWGVGILIVAVAIGLFAAILFPVFARAREAAMSAPRP